MNYKYFHWSYITQGLCAGGQFLYEFPNDNYIWWNFHIIEFILILKNYITILIFPYGIVFDECMWFWILNPHTPLIFNFPFETIKQTQILNVKISFFSCSKIIYLWILYEVWIDFSTILPWRSRNFCMHFRKYFHFILIYRKKNTFPTVDFCFIFFLMFRFTFLFYGVHSNV